MKDKVLEKVINEHLPIPMEGTWFYVEKSCKPCRGCYFSDKAFCPTQAQRFCKGKGKIVFRLMEPWNE